MTESQNPVGYSMSDNNKQRLAELVNQHKIPMIEDDVYRELHVGNQSSLPAKAYDAGEQIMLCGSFSKSLSPGFRIGWVVAGKQALRIQRLQHLSTLSSSIPIQLGLSHYLTFYSYDNHLKKLRKRLNERKKEHIALLDNSLPSSAIIHKNLGGYFVWIELPLSICVEKLYKLALEYNISVAPGIIFSSDKRFSHHIRLNCSYACDDKITEAIQTLGRLIKNMESQA